MSETLRPRQSGCGRALRESRAWSPTAMNSPDSTSPSRRTLYAPQLSTETAKVQVLSLSARIDAVLLKKQVPCHRANDEELEPQLMSNLVDAVNRGKKVATRLP
jgi:hypothetical protein